MKAAQRTIPLLAVVLATTALAGCGGDEAPADKSSVPESADFNDADVDFATEMIPHHAEALSMVDMTAGKELSPEVTALAEQIRAAQAPEIEEMTDWLGDWDQPVPENPRDHANAGHGDGMAMEGMEDLESMQGAEFEQAWLEAMIEHHEGAVEMAEAEVADGEHPDAVALAEDVASSQQQEIDQMERLLGEG